MTNHKLIHSRITLRSTVAIVAVGFALQFMTISEGEAAPPATPTVAHAEQLMLSNQERAAAKEIQAILKASPNNKEARLLQARLFLSVQQGIGAQAAITTARKAGADVNATRAMMAEALVLQRKYDDALKEADATQVPAAFAGDAARVRAVAFIGQRKLDLAKQQLELAEKLKPNDPEIQLAFASLAITQKDVKSAVTRVDSALRINPKLVRAMIIKGDLVRATGNLAGALPYYNQALDLAPESLNARIERAATLTDLRRDAEAKADISAVQKIIPEHPIPFYLLAVMSARESRWQEAQALMQRTKGALDNYAPALVLQGAIAHQTHNVEQARAYLKRANELQPNSPVVHRMLADSMLQRGDADGAIALLAPIAAQNTKDSRLMAQLGSAYAVKKDFVNSLKYYDQAITQEPNNFVIRMQRALIKLNAGQRPEAIADINTVLKLKPNYEPALRTLTLAQLLSHDFNSALTSAMKLAQLYPKVAINHNMLGAAYLGKGNLPEAEKSFLTAEQIDPKFLDARRNLAQVYMSTRRLPQAKAELLKVLELDPKNLRASAALADVARLQGNAKEQIQWLQKTVAIDPKIPSPRLALATAYLQNKEVAKAANEAATLAHDFPDNPAVFEILGKTQIATQRYGDAVNTLTKLSNAMPNSTAAAQLLGRAQFLNKQPIEARKSYNRALVGKDERAKVSVYLDLMRLDASEGKFAQLEIDAKSLRKADPTGVLTNTALGGIYFEYRRFADAARVLEAVPLAQRNRRITLALAKSYQQINQIEKAGRAIEQWQAGKPFDNVLGFEGANLYLESKNYQRAIAAYRVLLQKVPNDGFINNNMASALDAVGDKSAVTFAEKAYKLMPDRPEIADTLGWILVNRRIDVKRGLVLMQKAADRQKTPDVLYHLAVALDANGRGTEALEAVERAINQPNPFDSMADAKALQARLRNGKRR